MNSSRPALWGADYVHDSDWQRVQKTRRKWREWLAAQPAAKGFKPVVIWVAQRKAYRLHLAN